MSDSNLVTPGKDNGDATESETEEQRQRPLCRRKLRSGEKVKQKPNPKPEPKKKTRPKAKKKAVNTNLRAYTDKNNPDTELESDLVAPPKLPTVFGNAPTYEQQNFSPLINQSARWQAVHIQPEAMLLLARVDSNLGLQQPPIQRQFHAPSASDYFVELEKVAENPVAAFEDAAFTLFAHGVAPMKSNGLETAPPLRPSDPQSAHCATGLTLEKVLKLYNSLLGEEEKPLETHQGLTVGSLVCSVLKKINQQGMSEIHRKLHALRFEMVPAPEDARTLFSETNELLSTFGVHTSAVTCARRFQILLWVFSDSQHAPLRELLDDGEKKDKVQAMLDKIHTAMAGPTIRVKLLYAPGDYEDATYTEAAIDEDTLAYVREYAMTMQKNIEKANPLRISDQLVQTVNVLQRFGNLSAYQQCSSKSFVVPHWKMVMDRFMPNDSSSYQARAKNMEKNSYDPMVTQFIDQALALLSDKTLRLPVEARVEFLKQLPRNHHKEVLSQVRNKQGKWKQIKGKGGSLQPHTLKTHCPAVIAFAAMLLGCIKVHSKALEKFVYQNHAPVDNSNTNEDALVEESRILALGLIEAVLPALALTAFGNVYPESSDRPCGWLKMLNDAHMLWQVLRAMEWSKGEKVELSPGLEVTIPEFCYVLSEGLRQQEQWEKPRVRISCVAQVDTNLQGRVDVHYTKFPKATPGQFELKYQLDGGPQMVVAPGNRAGLRRPHSQGQGIYLETIHSRSGEGAGDRTGPRSGREPKHRRGWGHQQKRGR